MVQFGDVPTLSLPSHGTLGWDGQWDAGMGGGTVWGCSHSVPGTLGYMMGCDGMDSRYSECAHNYIQYSLVSSFC